MKKICAITTVDGTLKSFVIPAMREFLKHGYDVTLISNMSDEFISKYSSEFHLINMPMRRGISFGDMLKMPFKFYQIFRREKFDYVQYATTNAAWYASIAAKISGVPVRVNCLWGLLYTASRGWRKKFYWFLEKVPCFFSNYFTVASHKNKEIAIKDHLCKRENTSVIGEGGTIGVNLEMFDYMQRSSMKKAIVERYPILKNKIVFGYLGRIDADKGINELLEAFIDIDNPEMVLMLMGDFDNVRSGLNADLISKAQNSDRIIFTGYIQDVAQHLSAIDILVHPTYREGFSMVIQQAMAMGCAIITTDIPGPSEVIVENQCGLLVPPKDKDALKSAMNQLAGDLNMRTSFVENGLKRVKENFSREKMVRLTFIDRCEMMKKSGIL